MVIYIYVLANRIGPRVGIRASLIDSGEINDFVLYLYIIP